MTPTCPCCGSADVGRYADDFHKCEACACEWNEARRSPDARLTRSGADASMVWECTCGRLCLLEESKCDKCLKDRRP